MNRIAWLLSLMCECSRSTISSAAACDTWKLGGSTPGAAP
jgi:hypothetical protein